MITSQMLESKVTVQGNVCAYTNGYHVTDTNGVCVQCGKHTCEGYVWCSHQ
jgi:hypothetical protein